MYGDGAGTDRTCQSGLQSFVLEISHWTMLHSQADKVDNNQIETLIENYQWFTMREVADILKISKLIKLLVKIKNVFYFMLKTKRTFWPTPKINIRTPNTLQVEVRQLFPCSSRGLQCGWKGCLTTVASSSSRQGESQTLFTWSFLSFLPSTSCFALGKLWTQWLQAAWPNHCAV